MKVKKENLDEFIKKMKIPQCPLCGNPNWTITDTIFQIPEYAPDIVSKKTSAFPIIPLTCTKCGNTYFINVLAAKLFDAEENNKGSEVDEKENGESNG